MSTLHVLGEIIAERYRITASLGDANHSNTYIAEDFVANKLVAIKAISLHNLEDWKALELLERQAKVLAELDHPAVPRYLDYFYVDTPRDRAFYLVQRLIRGDSFTNLVENGWHPDEAGLKNISLQVLTILQYLQQQTPPIIHRDIQPNNLLRSRHGHIYLVDFGSVKISQLTIPSIDSTIVGAYGYTPPEQLYGKAGLNSDLYGLGATLLFLITGKTPEVADLDGAQLEVQSRAQFTPHFIKWLEKLMERSPNARFQSATEAITALHNPQKSGSSVSGTAAEPGESPHPKQRSKPSSDRDRPNQRRKPQPAGSRVIVSRTDGRFVIDVPPGDNHRQTISLWDILGWWHRLEIYPHRFIVSQGRLGFQRFYEGQTKNLIKAEVSVERGLWGETKTSLLLWEGVIDHNFAPNLTSVEKEWLVSEITDFLDELRLFKRLQKNLDRL